MIIDKKGKLFGKISIVDIVIILVLITAIAAIGYKYVKSGEGTPFTTKTDTVEIEFYEEEVNDFTAKAVKIGDLAEEFLQKANFGHVVDIKIGKAVYWVETDKGEIVAASKEGYSSIYIKMEATGILGDKGLKIGSGEYYIGKTITLNVGKAAFYGRISDIRKKE